MGFLLYVYVYLAGGEKREQEQWKSGEQGDKSKRGVREKGMISVGYQLCVCVVGGIGK